MLREESRPPLLFECLGVGRDIGVCNASERNRNGRLHHMYQEEQAMPVSKDCPQRQQAHRKRRHCFNVNIQTDVCMGLHTVKHQPFA